MRDFICGQQTLIHCSGEILGLLLFVFVLLLLAWLYVADWWEVRQARKRTPHPASCWTPRRCDGAKSCWCVPNCDRGPQ